MALPLSKLIHSPFRKIVLGISVCYIILNCLFAGLGYHSDPDKRVRGTDAVYYFIYLPSIIFDHDLDFKNNLEQIYGSQHPIRFATTGKPLNHWAIGSAILWAPFYLFAHFLTLTLNFLFQFNLPDQGYGGLYFLSIYVANSVYGFLGTLVTARLLITRFSIVPVAFSSFALLTATQITYYFSSFTTMSHLPSFFITALFIYFWITRKISVLTAISAGLMICSRWQNALFLIPLIISSLMNGYMTLKQKNYSELKRWLLENARFCLIVIVIFIPQMMTWDYIYHSPFLVPQGNRFLDFSHLPILNVLFHNRHGLFLWHPILLIGLGGLLLYWKKDRYLVASFGFIFILQLILNSAVLDWHAMWSFGHRRFISMLPIFIFGLTYFIEIANKQLRYVYLVIILFFALWNQLFIFQYQHSLILHDGNVTFQEFVIDKFKLPIVYKAHQLCSDAYNQLGRGNINGFRTKSKKAYKLSPTSYKVLIIYGLNSFLFDSYFEKRILFEDWHRKYPNVFVFKWALADILVANNEFSKAKSLFNPNQIKNGSIEAKIYEKINSNAPLNMRKEFLIEYQQHIKATYLL